jgi:hypothetical protein
MVRYVFGSVDGVPVNGTRAEQQSVVFVEQVPPNDTQSFSRFVSLVHVPSNHARCMIRILSRDFKERVGPTETHDSGLHVFNVQAANMQVTCSPSRSLHTFFYTHIDSIPK